MAIESTKTYLKTLASENNEYFPSYIVSMQEYDVYLSKKYNFVINDLKGKPIPPWQLSILRKLNPSDFEISSMIENKEYDEWLDWFSSVRNFIKENSEK